MKHIENIKNLFGQDFVENPLIESFDAGNIEISSGKIVACDPLITSEMQPFKINFPKGKFPITIHKERESNCVAYVEIKFEEAKILHWKLATTEGQNLEDLYENEIFGFPVESGMGCLMDFETQQLLNDLEKKLYERKGDDFMGIYEEFFHEHFFDENGAIDQYAILIPDDKKENNMIAFETGYGEGFYACYIGFGAENQPVKIICELIEIV